jgi:hypothetical protein
MTLEYVNRAKNFMSIVRRSVESGTTISWPVLENQLSDLFYQTHRDGVAQGDQSHTFRRQETEALKDALSRLLAMGAEQAEREADEHKLMALQSLSESLSGCFRDVVEDSLDLSKAKVNGLVEKYASRLGQLMDELKTEE